MSVAWRQLYGKASASDTRKDISHVESFSVLFTMLRWLKLLSIPVGVVDRLVTGLSLRPQEPITAR